MRRARASFTVVWLHLGAEQDGHRKVALQDGHLESGSRGTQEQCVGGGRPEAGWVSADCSRGLKSLGDQNRRGRNWGGVEGGALSPSHILRASHGPRLHHSRWVTSGPSQLQ